MLERCESMTTTLWPLYETVPTPLVPGLEGQAFPSLLVALRHIEAGPTPLRATWDLAVLGPRPRAAFSHVSRVVRGTFATTSTNPNQNISH